MAASGAGGEGQTEEDLAAELFGAFDSDDDAQPSPSMGGGLTKRPRPDEEEEDNERKEKAALTGDPGEDARTGKRKRRRHDVSRFFEKEAEEAGGSGDESPGGDLQDIIDDTGVEAGAAQVKVREELQRHHEAELHDLADDMAKRRAERGGADGGMSFLDRMEEKYRELEEPGPAPGSPSAKTDRSNESRDASITYIVPDAKDPKLWCCKTFAPERELCIALLHKAGECMSKKNEVPIYSAFFSPHLRGYLYIEAHKESDIRTFVRGIRGISPWQIRLVPVTQMPQVFVSSAMDAAAQEQIKPGDWVRARRGLYKGDLAQIDEIKDDTYIVKLKPRLDYGADKLGLGKTRDEKAHRQRPAARWFNKADVEAGDLLVNTVPRFSATGYLTYFLVDDEVYRDGFLYKGYKVGWLMYGEQVRPQEHELQDWRFAPPPDENTRPAADLERMEDRKLMPPPSVIPKKVGLVTRVPLAEGDPVIVSHGDLQNLRGIVTKAPSGSPTVLVQPIGVDGVVSELSLATERLSKYFEVGDHVKAVAGENDGDSGFIVRVMLDDTGGPAWSFGAMALVLSENINLEFKVRINHLKVSVQIAEPQDEIGEFTVGMLVRLGGRMHGIITRMEANSRACVLTTDGKRNYTSFGEMEPAPLPPRRMYEREIWTIDRKGQRIAPGYIVLSPRSSMRTAPIKCEVLYIHQGFVFLKATEEIVGDKAFIVVPGKKCEFVWTKSKQVAKVKDKEKEAESTQGKISYGVQMASDTKWLQDWFGKMMGMGSVEAANRGANSKWKKGAGVMINNGYYKGLRGEVRDVVGDKVRISLLVKPKLVMVPLTYVAPDDYEMPRESRWTTEPAPATPKVTKHFAGKRDGGDSLQPPPVFGGEEDDMAEPSDERQWDPLYLVAHEPRGIATPPPGGDETPVAVLHDDGEGSPAIGSVPGPAAQTPPELLARTVRAGDSVVPVASDSGTRQSVAPSSLDSTAIVGSITLPTKRDRPRRTSRLPEAGSMGSPSPSLSPVHQLSSRSISSVEARDEPLRSPWLLVGTGVRFTDKASGQDCGGWIVKVYGDCGHVVPESASPEHIPIIHVFKGHELRPWPCTERSDMIVVFDGPRRGIHGKVLGFDKKVVLILTMEPGSGEKNAAIFDSSTGSFAKADKKEVARYSPEWWKASEEGRCVITEQEAPPSPSIGVGSAKVPMSALDDRLPGTPQEPSKMDEELFSPLLPPSPDTTDVVMPHMGVSPVFSPRSLDSATYGPELVQLQQRAAAEAGRARAAAGVVTPGPTVASPPIVDNDPTPPYPTPPYAQNTTPQVVAVDTLTSKRGETPPSTFIPGGITPLIGTSPTPAGDTPLLSDQHALPLPPGAPTPVASYDGPTTPLYKAGEETPLMSGSASLSSTMPAAGKKAKDSKEAGLVPRKKEDKSGRAPGELGTTPSPSASPTSATEERAEQKEAKADSKEGKRRRQKTKTEEEGDNAGRWPPPLRPEEG